MTSFPSSYTMDDYETIAALYSSADEVNNAILTYDSSTATVALEDLISYYIHQYGTSPEALSDYVMSPDDPTLAALFTDSDVVETLQEWQVIYSSDPDSQVAQELERFIEATGAVPADVMTNMASFIDEIASTIVDPTTPAAVAEGETLPAESPQLLTSVMSLLMKKFGDPGLAILFYIIGSDMEIKVPDNAAEAAEIGTVNSDGTVTIQTQNGEITANLGETISFSTKGFGEIATEAQDTILDKIQETTEYLDGTLMEDLEAVDSEDPDSGVEIEKIKREMEIAKNKLDILSKISDTWTESLNLLTETASGSISNRARTSRTIVSNIS